MARFTFGIALLVIAGLQLALAKTVVYNWNIGWVTAAPDGFARPVIGINGQWPNPTIDAHLGDDVVVNVYNGLGNQSTSLHWHGIHQIGTSHMDGASGTSQCPIPPGEHFTYRFHVSY
jgi:iron transport multicopper oxidase